MILRQMAIKRAALLFSALYLVLGAALGLPAPAQAQSAQELQNQLDPSRRSTNSRKQPRDLVLSERQAVAQARAKAAGKVLRVSLVGEGGAQRYQIRMEHDGKVFTLYVHALTGAVTRGGQ